MQSIKQQLIIVNNHGRIHKAQEQSEGRKVSRTEAERKYLRYFLLMHANTDINKYTYICIMNIQSYTPYMISHLRLADMINVDCLLESEKGGETIEIINKIYHALQL